MSVACQRLLKIEKWIQAKLFFINMELGHPGHKVALQSIIAFWFSLVLSEHSSPLKADANGSYIFTAVYCVNTV